jgi:hypothetical protein
LKESIHSPSDIVLYSSRIVFTVVDF